MSLKQGDKSELQCPKFRRGKNPALVPSMSRKKGGEEEFRKIPENIFFGRREKSGNIFPYSRREQRRSNSPGLEKLTRGAAVDGTAEFQELFYTFPDPQWDGSRALCKSFPRVTKPCFAGWIISLIVLIVLLSDVINSLLIPSHVPSTAPLGFDSIYSTFRPPGSHLGADVVPGAHRN